MHMADALLSPAVGATFWLASGAALAWSARQVKRDERADQVPLMGVLGAFVFAAMMINFTIPGTGSSGHLGGGLLLSILVGPHAALIVMASVLTVQALFFADGGLLALGANIFNLGVCTCYLAYPLIYRPLVARPGQSPSRQRLMWATLLAAVLGLQLGAFGVVAETQLSGITSLPLGTFLMLMQPIHLAIGLVEGLATATLVLFVRQARPDLFAPAAAALAVSQPRRSVGLMAALGAVALLTAAVFSWFASSQPDGLEWSIARTTGQGELATSSPVHATLSAWQAATAWFPDYAWVSASKQAPALMNTAQEAPDSIANKDWPAVDAGTSLAGVVGGLVTLGLVMGVGYGLKRRKPRPV
ncbi:MAG: cobalamin biosynthesis protein CbiM [Comamonadaceae bacterium CG1_02_60_18]|nr:MAG: cobalamin biosynthesis protein CbiM [Comamonadaceae bacterium CG1_02_60_18]PIQ50765.1 MAG: cobalamin biosynthesis protein CbiM [Comamonadaceae bacterium CG12_big_fil_rev_8_21_14_0_65_59_15]